jgi:hypothetical protein
MGIDIWLNRIWVFFIWKKAKGGGAPGHGFDTDDLSLFCDQRNLAGDRWCGNNGRTVFCQAITVNRN